MDAGSGFSLIGSEIGRTLKLVEFQEEISGMKAANQSEIKIVGHCKLRFKFGFKILEHDFIVVEKLMMHCFLGADFLAKHRVIVDLSEGVSYYKDCPRRPIPFSRVLYRDG